MIAPLDQIARKAALVLYRLCRNCRRTNPFTAILEKSGPARHEKFELTLMSWPIGEEVSWTPRPDVASPSMGVVLPPVLRGIHAHLTTLADSVLNRAERRRVAIPPPSRTDCLISKDLRRAFDRPPVLRCRLGADRPDGMSAGRPRTASGHRDCREDHPGRLARHHARHRGPDDRRDPCLRLVVSSLQHERSTCRTESTPVASSSSSGPSLSYGLAWIGYRDLDPAKPLAPDTPPLEI